MPLLYNQLIGGNRSTPNSKILNQYTTECQIAAKGNPSNCGDIVRNKNNLMLSCWWILRRGAWQNNHACGARSVHQARITDSRIWNMYLFCRQRRYKCSHLRCEWNFLVRYVTCYNYLLGLSLESQLAWAAPVKKIFFSLATGVPVWAGM